MRPSLLLATHGIEGAVGAAAELARALARSRRFAAVAAGCHKGEPGLDASLDALPAGAVIVLPLLMAEGWTYAAIRRRLLGHRRAGEVRLAPPLGTHPGLARLVAARALALCARERWQPRASTLLLAGHGTHRHAGGSAAIRAMAGRLAARHRFAAVRVGFLDEAPQLAAVAAALGPGPCVAVGCFVDNGPHGRDDVGTALRSAAGPLAYAGAIGADAAVVPYLLERVRAAGPLAPPPAPASLGSA